MEIEGPGVIAYKIREFEKFKEEQDRWRRHVDADRRDLVYLREEVKELTDAFTALRRMLLTFALTIAGSAVVFALSVLIATNRLP